MGHRNWLAGRGAAEVKVEPGLPGLAVVGGALANFADAGGFGRPCAAHLIGRVRAGFRAGQDHGAGARTTGERNDGAVVADPVLAPDAAGFVPRGEAFSGAAVEGLEFFAESAAVLHAGDASVGCESRTVVHIPVAQPEIEGVIRGS